MSNIYCNGKYNYLIITPAVSIDQNYDNGNGNGNSNVSYYIQDDNGIDVNLNGSNNNNYTNNNNTPAKQAKKSSSSSHKSSMIILNSRSNLMPKPTRSHSWRWCTLLCSAIKCFGNSTGFSAAAASVAANTTSYTNNNNNNNYNNNYNIARNFVSSDHNNVLDLVVTNETNSRSESSPYEL